jgi:UDP-N-acetylglucosamine:LPS N-acetylglucosamine transferase
LASFVLRVPVVVAEQNAVPGAANRLAARFAKAAAVSFEGTALPRAVVTGNPVRAEVLAVDRDADRADARIALGLPDDRLVVLVTGGSLGARRINQAVLGALENWAARTDLAIRHVVGTRGWDEVATHPEPVDGLVWQAVPYEDRMDLALAAADVMVSRSGASTVAELTVVGLPSVLVPFPGATDDHQTANARALEAGGAAVVVADVDLTPERLMAEVDALLGDANRREAMAKAALALARRDAADRVADLVEAHARD